MDWDVASFGPAHNGPGTLGMAMGQGWMGDHSQPASNKCKFGTYGFIDHDFQHGFELELICVFGFWLTKYNVASLSFNKYCYKLEFSTFLFDLFFFSYIFNWPPLLGTNIRDRTTVELGLIMALPKFSKYPLKLEAILDFLYIWPFQKIIYCIMAYPQMKFSGSTADHCITWAWE